MVLLVMLLACPMYGCPQPGSVNEVVFSWTTGEVFLSPTTCEPDLSRPTDIVAVTIWSRLDPDAPFVFVDSLATFPGQRMGYTLPVPAAAGTVEVALAWIGASGGIYVSGGVCPASKPISLPFDHRTPSDPAIRKVSP